jgi:hypothetical protein
LAKYTTCSTRDNHLAQATEALQNRYGYRVGVFNAAYFDEAFSTT